MHDVLLVAAAFLACSVEMVEALTIVLALGLTRGWRSALVGAVGAVVLLSVAVGVLGSRLSELALGPLRLSIGGLLLVFGLHWLQKAIRRAGGVKALHDEEAIFATETRAAQSVRRSEARIDWYALVGSFKGVLIEGIEVAFIVVTVGSAQHDIGLASAGAAGAFVVVAAAGVAMHKPLARVPENSLKFLVGILLTSFGVMWILEGADVASSGDDLVLVGLLGIVSLTSALAVIFLRHQRHRRTLAVAGGTAE